LYGTNRVSSSAGY
jgi:hypothetical protein